MNYLVKQLLLLMLFITALTSKIYASHAAGAEIVYEWISGSTYELTFKFYRDCSGVAAPATVTICVTNTCSNFTQSITLQKILTLPDGRANGSSVSPGCSGFPTKCESNTSSIPGYEEWWYKGTVTLTSVCNKWVFSTNINARNTSNNITSGDLYVEATLDNQHAPSNSSPYFTIKPVPYVCLTQPYTFNNGAVDKDGDSLAFEIVMPRRASGSCGTVVDMGFMNSLPPYNLTNNPIQTNNSFTFDNLTGQMSFTPTLLGPSTLTVRVNEYRNGLNIGSVVRDIQIQVLICSSVQPTIGLQPGSLVNDTVINNRIEACEGVPMNFCFNITSPDSTAVLVPEDNHAQVAIGSNVTYNGLKTDSVDGCFSWTPPLGSAGLKVFALSVKDSACKPPGILFSQTLLMPIYVRPRYDLIVDTTICIKDSIQLSIPVGTTYIWSVKPGGSDITSLSCTNCSSPFAKPLIKTTYYIETDYSAFCGLNKDTATITVRPLPPSTVASANAPICETDTLKLEAQVISGVLGYEWEGPNNFYSIDRVSLIPNIANINQGYYYLWTTDGVCRSDADSIYVRVKETPDTAIISSNTPVCSGDTLMLYSIVNDTMVNVHWVGPYTFAAIDNNPMIINVSTVSAGRYYAVTEKEQCFGDTVFTDVEVNPAVFALIRSSEKEICQYDTIVVQNLAGNNPATAQYLWQWYDGNTTTEEGPLTIQWFDDDKEGKVYLTVTNLNCKAIDSQLIIVNPSPDDAFGYSADACVDKEITLEALRDYDLEYHWEFDGGIISDSISFNYYKVYWTTAGKKKVVLYTISENGCRSLGKGHEVDVHDRPVTKIEGVSNREICSGDSVLFKAYYDPAYTYVWTPKQFFIGNGEDEIYAEVLNSNNLYLTVTDEWGCTDVDSVSILTRPCCRISLPDAFSPNGDGRNDMFKVLTVGNHDIQTFKIFNRWGQVIYNSIDEHSGWDGRYKGVPQDMGTYNYYIRYRCADGNYYEAQGAVTLIR